MTDTTIADTTQEVTDATQEAVKQVNQLTQYVQDSIPGLITFGLKVLAALVAFFIGRLVIRWIRKIVRRSFERSGADKGVEQFVDSLLKYGLYALLVFSLISSLGFDTTSVAAVLASGGVAIGLALQGSLSNFAGGVLILLLKPFVVGDYIIEDTNGKEGTVKEIQIFYTKLSTIDNKTIVIPNGMLTNNSITNATAKDERQLDLRVGISYDADIRQAKSVIENLLIKDECIIKNEQINVFVHELADSAALIIFVVYLVMLYVATHQPLYILAGLGAGSAGAVVAYHLFTHVKTRVNVWRDPFGTYDKGGYQVAQSLFAIGTGGWFGAGLYQGQPDTIPVSAEDFIFSAISEEMGLIYAMCLILICVSCYVMFLNIAMQLHNLFYKMVALGLGTCYIFQVFLTIGGATKFIPSTGVTLPLVSYGGSSLISTLIMFAIIQGLYILREDEEEDIERRKKERLRAKRSRQESAAGYREAEYDPQRAKRSQKARKEAAQGKARKKQRVR